MWDELGISRCDDPKAISRAYAARLKKLDPDSDPAGFARLRGALEAALAEAAGIESRFEPLDDWGLVAFDFADRPDADEPMPSHDNSRSNEPPASQLAADRLAEWSDASGDDATLLNELNSALGRPDPATALSLYYRITARARAERSH